LICGLGKMHTNLCEPVNYLEFTEQFCELSWNSQSSSVNCRGIHRAVLRKLSWNSQNKKEVTLHDHNTTKIKRTNCYEHKRTLIESWFRATKPGRPQLNARIVKVLCEGCDVSLTSQPSQKPEYDSVGLAPFLERIYNHSGHKMCHVDNPRSK
jgi:hypothetical protein